MANLEENRSDEKQQLAEENFKFSKETKEKEVTPFEEKNIGTECDGAIKKQQLEEKKFEFSKETKDEKVVPFENNLVETDDGEINEKKAIAEIKDEILRHECSGEVNDGPVAEEKKDYINQEELDALRYKLESMIKESEEKIKDYQSHVKKEIEDEINEKLEEKINDIAKCYIEPVKNELKNINDEFAKHKEAYNKQVFRTIEIVGIFSSVVALLVVNAGIVNAADTFLKASILIVGLSCVIIIFATLIHFFFNVGETRKLGVSFFAPLGILILLLIAGLIAEFAYGEAYKKISSPEKDNISVEARVEQSFSDNRNHNMAIDSSKIVVKDSVKKIRAKKQQKIQMEKSK